MKSPRLYSLFERVEGDISLHNNKKYIRPRFVRIGARSFPRREAFDYYFLTAAMNPKFSVRPIKA